MAGVSFHSGVTRLGSKDLHLLRILLGAFFFSFLGDRIKYVPHELELQILVHSLSTSVYHTAMEKNESVPKVLAPLSGVRGISCLWSWTEGAPSTHVGLALRFSSYYAAKSERPGRKDLYPD